VIIKPGRCNIGLDHLSRLESRESGEAVDDQLPDANLFWVEAIPEYLEDITIFLSTGAFRETYSATQKFHMVVRAVDYQLIAGKLYKLGLDSILKKCVLDHERQDIPWECHNKVARGHVGGNATTQKFLQDGLWWEMIFKDEKVYARSCDAYQRVGNPPWRDELPLQPVRYLQSFEKWVVDFIGPINPTTKHSKARYIITTTDYLTHWVEATSI
jgi:hypothetical protein